MSISSELSRIQTDRNTIRTKLVSLGLVPAAANLDACASAVQNIENRGAVSATVQEGDTYTIPAGYHNGSGTVSGVAGGGNYSLQSKTITPTKTQQAITPGQRLLRPVRRHSRRYPGRLSGCFKRHRRSGRCADRKGLCGR